MAYISAEDVKAIRAELKSAFPQFKFGVRKESGGLAVAVTVKQGTCLFEGKPHAQVNEYWIDSHWTDAEDAMVLKKISEIMHNAPGRAGGKVYFDHSDVQTDYFHTAFYTHLQVGSWDTPYTVVEG